LPAGRGTGYGRPGRDDCEVVVGDRILELLPKESLLHEGIDAGRIGVGELPLEQPDGVRVLEPPKHELFFLLALGGVLPDGQCNGEQNCHDAHRDEQRGHRVPALPICLTR
jgi:hypothetical protein